MQDHSRELLFASWSHQVKESTSIPFFESIIQTSQNSEQNSELPWNFFFFLPMNLWNWHWLLRLTCWSLVFQLSGHVILFVCSCFLFHPFLRDPNENTFFVRFFGPSPLLWVVQFFLHLLCLLLLLVYRLYFLLSLLFYIVPNYTIHQSLRKDYFNQRGGSYGHGIWVKGRFADENKRGWIMFAVYTCSTCFHRSGSFFTLLWRHGRDTTNGYFLNKVMLTGHAMVVY